MPPNKSNGNRGGRKAEKAKKLETFKHTYSPSSSGEVSLELQQLLLDVFQRSCSRAFDEELPESIQEIKEHLYNRGFGQAFESARLREAYAARWSPSRALAYVHVFAALPTIIATHQYHGTSLDEQRGRQSTPVPLSRREIADHQFSEGDSLREDSSAAVNVKNVRSLQQRRKVICLGAGGGAELVAFAGVLHHLTGQGSTESQSQQQDEDEGKESWDIHVDCKFVDAADWSELLASLYSSLTSPPPLSNYASKEKQIGNRPLVVGSTLSINWVQDDLLRPLRDELKDDICGANLITIMFTLNELYSISISATTRLLLLITSLISPGAYLLVVDSPGSYSTVEIGKAATSLGKTNQEQANSQSAQPHQKQYPMRWLLEHTLLEQASLDNGREGSSGSKTRLWEKLECQESVWFRLSPKLRYPIPLEDMRHQLHLYKRI